MSITCIHGLEATACSRCRPVHPKPVRKPKPRPAKQRPTKPNLFDAEAQARLEQAMQSARQAAHAGTLLSKQLGKKPKPLSPIEVATNG
nr:MAG TPA: hypothetical protein [Caudoviricetes sp.]